MFIPSNKLKLMIQSYSTPKKEHQPIFSAPNNVSKNKQSVQFKDSRSEATAQLKAQQMANQQTIQRQENKTGMPDNLKSGIENLSGIDMSDVKVHYNSPQPAQLQAHAFAQGNQIHIASGQEKHLPHEAWHVVQQKQGRVAPTKQLKGKVNINDDAGLEKEADVMGAKAVQMKSNETLKAFYSTSKKNNIGQSVQQLMRHRVNSGKTRLEDMEELQQLKTNLAKAKRDVAELEVALKRGEGSQYYQAAYWLAKIGSFAAAAFTATLIWFTPSVPTIYVLIATAIVEISVLIHRFIKYLAIKKDDTLTEKEREETQSEETRQLIGNTILIFGGLLTGLNGSELMAASGFGLKLITAAASTILMFIAGAGLDGSENDTTLR